MQPEVFSALIGALVGGLISLVLQVVIFVREKRINYLKELAQNRSRFLDLWFKVEKSREFIDRLDEILVSAREKQKLENIDNISLVTGIIYTNVEKCDVSEEQMYFLSLNRGEIDVSHIHRFLDNVRIMLDISDSYKQKREKLFEIMPGKVIGEDLVIGSLTEDEALRAGPYIAYLDMYVRMMNENIEKTKRYGILASESIILFLKEKLGISIDS